MKKIFKPKLLICVGIMVLVTALIIGALLLLKGNREVIAPPPKTETTDKDKGGDDTIVLDGVLDEKVWSSQRKLQCALRTDEKITLDMTSYFGEKGVYFAFDVKDPALFYSTSRETTANSGVEFYVSSLEGGNNINGYGYEIDITAGGATAIKKYLNNTYSKVHADFGAKVKVDGEINTFNCVGYTAEVYLPYELFGGKCEQVYAMPALVRTLSAESTDRQWYCFGLEDRASEWEKASTWWTFGEKGLEAFDVTLETDAHGKIEGKSFVVAEDDYKFKLAPESGYYATSVTVNGTDVTKDLLFENGEAYYIVEEVKENLKIGAKYAMIPKETVAVTGHVWDGKATVPNATAYAVKAGWYQQITVETDGTYSAQVPDIDGIQIAASADGYISATSVVKRGGGKADIVLEKNYLGATEKVPFGEFNDVNWDFSRLAQDRARTTTRAFKETVMHTELFANELWAESYITLPKREGADTRAGFVFVDEEGDDLFVALTMGNEKGQYEYVMQFISRQGNYWEVKGKIEDIAGDKEIKKLANSKEGVRLLVAYHNGTVDVWVHDKAVTQGAYVCKDDGKNVFSPDAKVAVGLQSWNNKTAFQKLDFGAGSPPESKIPKQEDNWARDWDLSKISDGIATSIKEEGQSKVLLHKTYRSKVCISGSVTLQVKQGKDTRTGFWFRTADGRDVFCSLTLENEKGQKNYKLQFIGNEASSWARIWEEGWEMNMASWKFPANSDTVDYSVYYENGEISVWLDGKKAAFGVRPVDAKGKPIFSSTDRVAVGLQSWEFLSTFKNLKVSVSTPDWNLGKLAEGKAVCKTTDQTYTMLTTEKKLTNYISANVILPKEDGKDTRAGFRFTDENGRHVFVTLLMENNAGQYKYKVQFIGQEKDGKQHWDAKGTFTDIAKMGTVKAFANSTNGVPFEVEYVNGTFNVWLNGQQVAKEAFVTKDGKAWLAADTKVNVGLECWNYGATFTGIVTGDKKK